MLPAAAGPRICAVHKMNKYQGLGVTFPWYLGIWPPDSLVFLVLGPRPWSLQFLDVSNPNAPASQPAEVVLQLAPQSVPQLLLAHRHRPDAGGRARVRSARALVLQCRKRRRRRRRRHAQQLLPALGGEPPGQHGQEGRAGARRRRRGS